MEQLHARAFFPAAAGGIGIAVRYRIVFIKSPEMIHAYNVIHAEAVAQASDPPGISRFFMIVPVIQRIAPELSLRGKTVRRTSGYGCRPSVRIELEHFPVRKNIRGIHCHVDGNIADDLNAEAVDVFLQLKPLTEKFVLHKAVILFRPAFFSDHKISIAVKPLSLGLKEGFVVLTLRKPLIGLLQDRRTVLIKHRIVHPVRIASPGNRINLFLGQQSLFFQGIKVYEIRIARKS